MPHTHAYINCLVAFFHLATSSTTLTFLPYRCTSSSNMSSSTNPLGTPDYHLEFLRTRINSGYSNLLHDLAQVNTDAEKTPRPSRAVAKTRPTLTIETDRNPKLFRSPNMANPQRIATTMISPLSLTQSQCTEPQIADINRCSSNQVSYTTSPTQITFNPSPVLLNSALAFMQNNLDSGKVPGLIRSQLPDLWTYSIPESWEIPDATSKREDAIVALLCRFQRQQLSDKEAAEILGQIQLEELNIIGWRVSCKGAESEHRLRGDLLSWSVIIDNIRAAPCGKTYADRLRDEIKFAILATFRECWEVRGLYTTRRRCSNSNILGRCARNRYPDS